MRYYGVFRLHFLTQSFALVIFFLRFASTPVAVYPTPWVPHPRRRDAMLLFSRIRNSRWRGHVRDRVDDPRLPGAPPAGALDSSGRNVIGGGGAADNNDVSSRRGRRSMLLGRIAHPSLWRRGHREQRPPLPGRRRESVDVSDPMEPFSSVAAGSGNAQDGAVMHDDVADLLSRKIYKHHQLWHRLAFGKPRRPTGYALQPMGPGGTPLPLSEPTPRRALPHIASWRSPPKAWAGEVASSQGNGGGHNQITSIDYGNADEVVLSSTQDADTDVLRADNTLPEGAPRFMLHPYAKRKVAWDLFVAAMIVYGCVSIPLRIGFDLGTGPAQIIADSVVDVAFVADMVLSFRTAYLAPDGDPVTNPRDIAVRYLKGSFFIDLCSTVPVDLIMLSAGNSQSILRSTKLLRTLRLLRLARIMKLSSTIGGKEDELTTIIHPSLWALIKMFGMLLFIAHIMGCMWHWVAVLSPNQVTWVAAYGVDDTPWEHQYLVAVYWAFTTMTTVGYGDVTSDNDLERGFAIVGMIVGATVFGYIIGNVAVIMENFDVVNAIESSKMNQIKDWLYDRKFPPALAEKIRRQYSYVFKEMSVFDNSEIVDVMPSVMATSLIYAQHRAVAKGVGFLAKRPPVLVCRLLRRMVPCFANCGDVLYLEHEVGGHWYILRSGNVSFYVSLAPLEKQSDVVLMRSLSDDGHFGLTPVLLNVLNSETATATSATDLLMVRKDDLVDILHQWPEVMAELTDEAERHFRAIKAFREAKRPGSTRPPGTRSRYKLKPKAKAAAVAASTSGLNNLSPVPPTADPAHVVALAGTLLRAGDPISAEDGDKSKGGVGGGGGDSSSGGGGGGGGGGSGGGRSGVSGSGGGGGGSASLPGVNVGQSVLGDSQRSDTGATARIGEGKTSLGSEWSEESPSTATRSHPDTPGLMTGGSGHSEEKRELGADHDGTVSSGRAVRSPAASSPAAKRPSTDRAGVEVEDAKTRAVRLAAVVRAVSAGVRFEDSSSAEQTTSETAGTPTAAAAAAAAPAEAAAAAAVTPDSGAVRPPPIITADPRAGAGIAGRDIDPSNTGNDVIADLNNGREVVDDPEKIRGCFVAKTFSPSDLGMGELRRGSNTEAVDRGNLMMYRRLQHGSSIKGTSAFTAGNNGRKGSVEEGFGFEDTQVVLGGVVPDGLFSIAHMFHPEATLKVLWDLWVSLVIVWSVVEVTFRLGFDRPAEAGWLVFSYCVDGLFFLDMLVSLRTALVTKDGVVVANQKQVAIAYLKGWFFVDMVSTVPWHLIVLRIAVGNRTAASSTKLLRSLRLVRLLRLIRLLKLPDFMEEWENSSPMGPSSARLGRLLVIMAFSAHINACIWYAAGLHTSANSSWVDDYYCSEDTSSDCPDSKSSFSLYLVSIYFAFTTMTTTGYGDILPNRLSVEELTIAIASEVLGATIFAWVIGNLVNLVLNLDPAERNRKSMMNYLAEYIRQVPLSSKAKQTVLKNYAFHLEIHSVFNQPSILEDLLPHLQNQAFVFLWRSLMPKLPFFCSMENQVTGFVRVVLPLLKPATFCQGDMIITPKVGTREMAFIVSGEVEVRLAKGRRNFKTAVLGERRYFGEMFMLLPEHVPFRGLAQVRATNRVRMMQLTRTAFTTLEARHPNVSKFMAKQLFDPQFTPLWVVVNAAFQCEVAQLEANTKVSDANTLGTPRNLDGFILEKFRTEGGNAPQSPGGSFFPRKKGPTVRSPPVSPGAVARREAATRQVHATKSNRMVASRPKM